MAVYVQYGKVGKPILYSTLPTASADLNGVIGQVGDNVYQCDGTQWVALALPANLQDKSVTITENGTTEITADSGYDGMSKATIITNVTTPTEEKTVDLDMASGNQVVTPTSGKVLSKVTVTKPSTMLAENIKKDVNIGGVVGTYEGVILPTYEGLLRFASTPTISLSNNTLTITAVTNATSYAIYSNNALLTTITTTSVDLSTLITSTGTYNIYAIAKGTGYADSEKSNEVSYEVEEQGHELTFSGGNYIIGVQVNGNAVASGYTLKNGDIITASITADSTGVTGCLVINGTTYYSAETLSLNNQDINITTINEPSTGYTLTINYTEASTSGYSVSCSSYADKTHTALVTQYSTDNGSTWTEFDSTGVLTSQATQIKFRMSIAAGYPLANSYTPTLSSVELGMTLARTSPGGIDDSGFDIESTNYTLAQNVTDVVYSE